MRLKVLVAVSNDVVVAVVLYVGVSSSVARRMHHPNAFAFPPLVLLDFCELHGIRRVHDS
jgi:hypothetical protein